METSYLNTHPFRNHYPEWMSNQCDGEDGCFFQDQYIFFSSSVAIVCLLHMCDSCLSTPVMLISSILCSFSLSYFLHTHSCCFLLCIFSSFLIFIFLFPPCLWFVSFALFFMFNKRNYQILNMFSCRQCKYVYV